MAGFDLVPEGHGQTQRQLDGDPVHIQFHGAPIHNIRIPQTMAMKGQFLRGDRIFNPIHMHMTGKMLNLQWDIKVAVVQEYVQRASSTVLVAAEPG